MMAQEIVLPVKVYLENLLNIAKEMRSLLGTLKINSTGYQKVEAVISNIEKRIQLIQVISSRLFIDEKQFTAIDKEILDIYDDFTKLKIAASKIKFSDLSLDASLKELLKAFDAEIKAIKDSLELVKNVAKNTFLESDIGKAWAIDNPKEVGKSFEEITEIIKNEVDKQLKKLNEAIQAQKDYKERMASLRKLNAFIKGGHELTAETLGEELYNKIFNTKGNFKNNGRSLLTDWLVLELKLDKSKAEELVKLSGNEVRAAFALANGEVEKALKQELARLGANLKTERATTNNGKTYSEAIANENVNLSLKKALQEEATLATLKLAKADEEGKARLEEVIIALANFKNECVASRAALLLMGSAFAATETLLKGLSAAVDAGRAKLTLLDLATSRLLGISNFVNRYVGAYAIIRKVTLAIRNAFSNIKELDKVITSIAVVTNMSLEDLWNKVGQYTLMALQYGVMTKDVYTVSQIFYQQGLQTALVMDLTTETLKMAKIAGIEYSSAANAMTVAVRAFKIEMEDALLVTDTYSALAAKFAVSSAEIANAMEKTASSAASVGMTLESTSAFISVMEQTTRESALNIGSALKSIISRYGEMKASPDKLINVDGEEVAFNKVDTALSSIGISIKDAAGQFRNFDEVIMELAKKWGTLDNNTQRYIATVMAGNRQQSRFIALVSNYDELSRAMQVASNSENASIVQVAKTMDSLESKTNLLKNAFSQLYLDLHIENGLKSIYDILTRIVTTIGKLGTLKGAIPTLMSLFNFGFGAKGVISGVLDIINTKRDITSDLLNKDIEKKEKIESTLDVNNTLANEKIEDTNKKMEEFSLPTTKPVEVDVNTNGLTTDVTSQAENVITDAANNILLASELAAAVAGEAGQKVGEAFSNSVLLAVDQTVPQTISAVDGLNQAVQNNLGKLTQDEIAGIDECLKQIDQLKELLSAWENYHTFDAKSRDRFSAAQAQNPFVDPNNVGTAIQREVNNINYILSTKGIKFKFTVEDPEQPIAEVQEAADKKPVSVQVSLEEALNKLLGYESELNNLKNNYVEGDGEYTPIDQKLGLKMTTDEYDQKLHALEKAAAEARAEVDALKESITLTDNALKETEQSGTKAGDAVHSGANKGTLGQLLLDEQIKKTNQDLQDQQQKGENAGEGIKRGSDGGALSQTWLLKNGRNIGRISTLLMRMVGAGIMAAGAAHQDESTDKVETSKLLTGFGNGLSSAGMGAGMVASMLPSLGWKGMLIGGVVGFLASGIGAIFDGLHMSLDERIELEKKEAKEKADDALKALAKVTDLSSSIDNIKLLLKVMYNSTEDMKAYKDAMNTMADLYPGLISTYDEAGNAIIDLDTAEQMLAATRLEAARTARTASIALGKLVSSLLEAVQELETQLMNMKSGKSIESGGLPGTSHIKEGGWYLARSNDDSTTVEVLSSEYIEGVNSVPMPGGISASGRVGTNYRLNVQKIIEGLGEDLINNVGLSLNGRESFTDENITYEELLSILSYLQNNAQFTTSWFSSPLYAIGNKTIALDGATLAEDWNKWIEQILKSNQSADMTYSTQELNKIFEKYASIPEVFGGKTSAEAYWDQDSFTWDEMQEKLEFVRKQIINYENTITGIRKTTEFAIGQEALFDTANVSELLDIPDLTNLETNKIYSSLFNQLLSLNKPSKYKDILSWYNDKDGDFNATSEKIAVDFISWYALSLTDAERKLLETADFTLYKSVDEITSLVTMDKLLLEALKSKFIESNKANRDRLLLIIWNNKGEYNLNALGSIAKDLRQLVTNIGELFKADENGASYIISLYADYFTGLLLEINNLANEGYEGIANTRLTALASLANGLKLLKTSKELQELFTLITSIDFSNFDLLSNTIKAINDYRKNNNITSKTDATYEILSALQTAQDNLLFNTNTLLESITQKTIDVSKELESMVSSNKSGLSLDKAVEEYKKLSLPDKKFEEIFNYDPILLKYVYNREALIEIINKDRTEISELVTKANDVSKYYNAIGHEMNTVHIAGEKEKKYESSTKFKEALKLNSPDINSMALDELVNLFFTSDREHTIAEFRKFVKELATLANNDAKAAQAILDNFDRLERDTYFQQIDWASIVLDTDYTGRNKDLMQTLAGLVKADIDASWNTILDATLDSMYGNNQDAKNIARESIIASIDETRVKNYLNAISELLTYDVDHYLSETTKQLGKEFVNENLSIELAAEESIKLAEEFLGELAKLIGKGGYTLEQYNQDASSILEKTLSQKTTGKSLLDFATEDEIGVSQLEGLANILGTLLNKLVDVSTGELQSESIFTHFLTFDANTGTYKMKVDASFENFIDTLNAVYGNVIDKTSEQYIDALKGFNKTRIDRNKKMDNMISEEIKSLESAKPGDMLDWTLISSKIADNVLQYTSIDKNGAHITKNKTVEYALNEYGAKLSDGLLKLSENANLLGIARVLKDAAQRAGSELKDSALEVADTVLNILKSYVDAINAGISGGLSHIDADNLSKKATDLGIDKLDFVTTANGLKLAQHSAIELYTALLGVDALLARLVFDELNKSLQESNEHYKGISEIANRIRELEAIPNNIRSELYKRELALAKEIYAVRSTTEDSSFNFMSKDIPGALKNPLNYFNNWASAIKTFNDAMKSKGTYTKEGKTYKSGFVDYEYWYNLVTEMNNLASQGQQIEFAGVQLDGSLEKASELIRKGAQSLVVADTGEVKVALLGMALNFLTGTDAFSGGVEAGIQELAKSLIDMLDGMILLLETVVAMKKLTDIDSNKNEQIDLTDLFPTIEPVSGKLQLRTLEGLDEFILAAGQELNNIIINNESLSNMISRARNEGLDQAEAENFTAIMDSLYQLYKSGNYDPNNIWQSILDVMASTGFSGTVKVGDRELIIQNGTTILTTKEGKYLFNGKEYDSLAEATARAAVDRLGFEEKIDYANEKATQTTLIKTFGLMFDLTDITITADKNGKLTFTYDGQDYPANNVTDFIDQFLNDLKGWTDAGKLQFKKEVLLELGITKLDSFTYRSLAADTRAALESALASGELDALTQVIDENPVLKLFKNKTPEEIAAIIGFANIPISVDDTAAGLALSAITEKIKEITDNIHEIKFKASFDDSALPGDKKPSPSNTPRLKSGGLLPNSASSATGNAALAQGTLMGELGPELVVSNGHYFVAGQNGAEFVDLDSDAIVFNHLLTRSLLEKGMSSGRGQALVSEKRSVAYAKGNIHGGPAKAGAESMLSALYELKAQWERLAGLSIKDFATKGGSGGGGDPKAFIKDLERWYNWLQRIATLEKEISLEESKRAEYQSAMTAKGKEYYTSLIDSLKKLQEQAAVLMSLNKALEEYAEKRKNELNTTGSYRALYEFDEEGQLKYKTGKYEWLATLAGTDANGKPNYTAKEQYDAIVAAGFKDTMLYDSSGNKIKKDDYAALVLAFWDGMESERQEMQNLYDNVLDGKKKVVDLQKQLNDIMRDIEDNQIAVENKVLTALESARQREIDDAKKEKDAIQESTNQVVDGLNRLLEQERRSRDSLKSSEELSKLQRRLGILQRTGGSAAEIANLLLEISDKLYDKYFETQERLIQAMKDASDLQILRLDTQIKIMEETLEYEKEHGLLWNEVYDILEMSADEVANYIKDNDVSYFGKSDNDLYKNLREDVFSILRFLEFMKDTGSVKNLAETYNEDTQKNESEKITKESEEYMKTSDEMASTPLPANGAEAESNKQKQWHIADLGSVGYWDKNVALDHLTNLINTALAKVNQAKKGTSERVQAEKELEKWKNAQIRWYDRGGMVDETGPAILHAKEAVLTARQTDFLRNDLLGNQPNSLLSFWTDMEDMKREMLSLYGSTTNTPVIIENATVEMNVSEIASDYDARRAGEQALDKILAIARKTSASNRVSR